jgi:hypothetical protein
MSKYNNVNPGQYKVAGRERPGRDFVQDDHKSQYTTSQAPPKGHIPQQPSATSKAGKRNTE